MKNTNIELEVYRGLPCCTETFKINGINAEQNWFVNNYDNGDGVNIEYGCNNRVTDKLDLNIVRDNLPETLSWLTDEQIEKIQSELDNKLVCGSCGWCV